jgi:hypothetical protein
MINPKLFKKKQITQIITKSKFKLLLQKCGEAKYNMDEYLNY